MVLGINYYNCQLLLRSIFEKYQNEDISDSNNPISGLKDELEELDSTGSFLASSFSGESSINTNE